MLFSGTNENLRSKQQETNTQKQDGRLVKGLARQFKGLMED